MRNLLLTVISLIVATFSITSCATLASISVPFHAPIDIELIPLVDRGECSGMFSAADLPHEIQVSSQRVHDFDSLGTGLATNDFDNDGDIDIVMANIDGPTVVLWNETQPQKKLHFRRQNLTDYETSIPTSSVLAVDVNADGWLDLAFTHTNRPPTLWLNQSATDGLSRIFTRDPDFIAGYFAHVMDWADLDKDGDLDIVTATYDHLLSKEFGGYIPGGGVTYYENRDSGLLPRLLASGADALALLIMDIDHDGWSEIIVGNDYTTPDYIFTRTDDEPIGWKKITPLLATPTNTMSYVAGDINNDGQLELFAADMKPYKNDKETLAAWAGLLDGKPPDRTQKHANVLLSLDSVGNYQDIAVEATVEATGWSWSSKFGDLNSDGNLDLYVVNGVITAQVFNHLLGDELVEENQVRMGNGNGHFSPKPEWKLNSTRSGRGMSMADLDNDGDLDVIVSNMRASSQVFQNQLCGGSNLLVDLRQPNTRNTYAIGTRAVLVTKSEIKQTRFVRAQSGYLSGDSSRLHFGIPDGDEPTVLEITWPDGRQSTVHDIESSTRLVVKRQ